MVTRKKKKTDVEQFDEQVVMKEEYYDSEPVFIRGSHLTVTRYPDGSTKLEWDHDRLEEEVRQAIASVEQIDSVTPTKKTKGKKK